MDVFFLVDFFVVFVGCVFVLYLLGGSRLLSLLGGVGKGMVFFGRNCVVWCVLLIVFCVM